MLIREAESRDLKSIQDLAARFISETSYRQHLVYDASAIERLFWHCLENGLIAVAEHETAGVVGMLVLAYDAPVTGGPVLAQEIAWWVEPEHRGGSAARRMLGFGIERARQDGCSSVTMRQPSGSPVGELYRRLGFEPVETSYSLRF